MRRISDGSHDGVRSSALWGGGPKANKRGGALWGGLTHSFALVAVITLALTVGVATSAAATNGGGRGHHHAAPGNAVPDALLADAAANPTKMFRVIVQTDNKGLQRTITMWATKTGTVKGQLDLIHGVTMKVPGSAIVMASQVKTYGDLTITLDSPVQTTSMTTAVGTTDWQNAVGVSALWSRLGYLAPQAPAIAVVDSGIDASKTDDFGPRVIAHADFVGDGTTGDPEGHGTMVAGVAAGASNIAPGVAQNAPLVDVRVADGRGMAYTSDVIAGLDWILQHKAQYNIGVANLSLASNSEASFLYDPLDQAVEKLWLNGVVVVAAAGNNGAADAPVALAAPGNDPFVITVGAVDTNGTADQTDDFRAPWSAYGHTADGFAKPELVAPGRYIAGPVSTGSYLLSQVPDRVTAPGYMWMSGTSFSAPVAAGAAAQLLAIHPGWTPDQVKGALMYAAQGLAPDGTGIGEVNAARAALVVSPPNPNANLNAFVSSDEGGLKAFDASAWSAMASTNASWTSASWTSASWTSASWTSASWTSASWTRASWTSASWTSASWTSASWTSASWVR